MLKRTTSLVLALLMAASLAACGGDKKPESSTPTPSPTAVPTKAPEPDSEPESSEVSGFADRETIDLGLFQVSYPETWSYDEEDVKKEDSWARVVFYEGESWDDAEKKVFFDASEESTYSYRSDLNDYHVNLKDFAEGNLAKETIGNTEFAYIPENNFYIYRHEPTGITYRIDLMGDRDDAAVKELLDGIQLNLEDGDNVESPWPWEGEPFQPVLSQQMVGSYTIVPEYIPFEEPQGVMDIMEHKFLQQGNQVFHLLNDTLDTYEYAEGGLKSVSTTALDKKCEYISSDNNGMLYLSTGLASEVVGVKDGQQVLKTTITEDLAMHPSGTWGLSFWLTKDTQKVTNQDGALTTAPWVLTGLTDDAARQGPFSMINDIEITESHVMVTGNTAEGNLTKIIVYDPDGNQLLELGASESSQPDSLGSITGMAETENGFVAIDGNMRAIQFWNKEGAHLGSIAAKDIFGTDYPWLEDLQLLDDGSLLLLATQKREDESANELMFFKLTGF